MSALLDSFLRLFEWSTVRPILVSNLKLIFSLWKIQPNLLLLILVKMGIMYRDWLRPIYRCTDTIIGYRFWKKLYFFCHIHNYTEYNQQWNVFSALDLSKCTHIWSSGHCSFRKCSSTTTACNFIQDSLVWNTLYYINIYYRTIISPINI